MKGFEFLHHEMTDFLLSIFFNNIPRKVDISSIIIKSCFLRKLLMARINKMYRFMENTSKMTFPEKNKRFYEKMLLVL